MEYRSCITFLYFLLFPIIFNVETQAYQMCKTALNQLMIDKSEIVDLIIVFYFSNYRLFRGCKCLFHIEKNDKNE